MTLRWPISKIVLHWLPDNCRLKKPTTSKRFAKTENWKSSVGQSGSRSKPNCYTFCLHRCWRAWWVFPAFWFCSSPESAVSFGLIQNKSFRYLDKIGDTFQYMQDKVSRMFTELSQLPAFGFGPASETRHRTQLLFLIFSSNPSKTRWHWLHR